MIAELLDIFDTMRMLISTLGYPVFEPIVKHSTPSHFFFVRGGGRDGKDDHGQTLSDVYRAPAESEESETNS